MNKGKSWLRGQSLVEFALVLPIFIFLALMVFDLGRVVYYSSTVHNAAREAARYGIVNPTDVTGMEQAAIDYAVGLNLDIVNFNPPPTIINPTNLPGQPTPSLIVYIRYTFNPATPFVSSFIAGGSIVVKGEAKMKLEALP